MLLCCALSILSYFALTISNSSHCGSPVGCLSLEKCSCLSQEVRDRATSGSNKIRHQPDQSYSYIMRKVWYHQMNCLFWKIFPYLSLISISALLGVHRTQSLKGRSSSARTKKSSTEEETINGSRRRQRLSSISDTEKSSYQSYGMTKTPKRSPIVWMIPPMRRSCVF